MFLLKHIDVAFRFIMVYFSQVISLLIQFSPIRSIQSLRSNSVYFIALQSNLLHFGHIQSTSFISVHYGLLQSNYIPLNPVRSYLIHFCHILFTSIQFSLFHPLWYTSIHFSLIQSTSI